MKLEFEKQYMAGLNTIVSQRYFNIRRRGVLNGFVLSLALGLILVFQKNAAAQVYPVQATTQLVPPYSLHLSDYVASGSERLSLHVFLADIARPELSVRFRLRLQGQGITLETKPEYLPGPVFIQGGIPLRLISTDLADYFDPQNLNFTGMTRREYEQKGMLPEGVYQICFEVLEYNRGIKISNTACATAWMILNDPPIINLPRQNEKIKPVSPQNVVLQWTPRHTGSPNSAFTTEYELRMVEVWPSDRNPNDAVLTSPAILETTTSNTTYIYGPSEVQLELGRRYAFRVKAKSIAGVEELDLFKNQGYSETYSFIYGDACDLPTGISANAPGSSRIDIQWEGLTNHTAFKVRYRESGTTNWYESSTVITNTEFSSLKPGTTYEYQVMGTCGFFDGQYSPVATVRTADAPIAEYSCNMPVENFNLDPSKRAETLKVGDIIKTGDFDVQVSKVSGSGGSFTGEGVVVVPMLNKVKVRATFNNITVANETDGYRMVNGFMNVTGAGVEVVPQGVLNFMDKLSEVLDAADSVLDVASKFIPTVGPDPASFAADTLVHVQGNILSVQKDASGNVVVVTTNGKTTTIPAGTNAAITDENGKGYVVDKNGNTTKTTAAEAVAASKREYNFEMKFFASKGTTNFGLDELKDAPLALNYEKLGDKYFAPWKAIDSNHGDIFNAKLLGPTGDGGKVRFELESEPLNPNASANQTWAIALNGAPAGQTNKLIAYYTPADTSKKEQILGKVNVVGYDAVSRDLVIVPVNKIGYPYNVQSLKDSLNRIYGQAVASWNVTIDPGIDVALGQQFDDGNSGLLSNYTDDMKKVIDAYGKDFKDNTYYLFLVQKPASGKTAGFMPRSKQAGFIFVDAIPTESQMINTIAHELGHGAFTLQHTFVDYPTLTQGSTQNLMDYNNGNGNQLLKYQWDKIHDPVTVIGLFEEDEDSRRKATFTLEYSEFNFGGTDDILLYLLNNKRDELFKQLVDLDYYSSKSDADKIWAGRNAFRNVLGGDSNFLIGDEGELLYLTDRFADAAVTYIIAKHHTDILEFLKTNSGDKKISFMTYVSAFSEFADKGAELKQEFDAAYNSVYAKYFDPRNIALSTFKQSLVTTSLKGNVFTKIGLQNFLLKVSNQKLKGLLRGKFPGISNGTVIKILSLKRQGKQFEEMDDLIKSMTQEDISKLVSDTDELVVGSLKGDPSNFVKGILDPKDVTVLDLVGDAFNFLDLASTLHDVAYGGGDVSGMFNTIVSLMPVSGAGLYAYIFQRIADDTERDFNRTVWESGGFSMIVNWNNKWKGKPGLPNDFVYLYYTDDPSRVNPTVVPTSFVILNKSLASEIFGFTPVYVDCGFKGNIKKEGLGVSFVPEIQVGYLK